MIVPFRRKRFLIALGIVIAGGISGAVKLEKQYDIPLPVGTTAVFPVGHGEVLVWSYDRHTICRYRGSDREDCFEISRGEGPGDLNRIGNILKRDGRYFIWDKQLRRLSIFTTDFNLESCRRIPELGLLANLMDLRDTGDLWEWAETGANRRGNVFTRKIGFLYPDGNPQALIELEGMFSLMDRGKRRHNLDKGILIGATDGENVYYADHREYKIHIIPLAAAEPSARLFIHRDWEPVPCTEEYTDLQYHLWKEPPADEDWYEIYPKYLPPLYLIAADRDSDFLLVVRNTPALLSERQSEIDIFNREGTFLGTVKTPITINQWVVFPPEFYFRDSVVLMDNRVYLHLDEKLSVYLIGE